MYNYFKHYRIQRIIMLIGMIFATNISLSKPRFLRKKKAVFSSKKKKAAIFVIEGGTIFILSSLVYILVHHRKKTHLLDEESTINTTSGICSDTQAQLICKNMMRKEAVRIVDDIVNIITSYVHMNKYHMTTFILEGVSKESIDADERYAINTANGKKTYLTYNDKIGRYTLTTNERASWKIQERWEYMHNKYPMFFSTTPIPTDRYVKELDKKINSVKEQAQHSLIDISLVKFTSGFEFEEEIVEVESFFITTNTTRDLSQEENEDLVISKVWKEKKDILSKSAFAFKHNFDNAYLVRYFDQSELSPIKELRGGHPWSGYDQILGTKILAPS